MEFIDALDSLQDVGDGSGSTKSIRQRIIAAQIRDSEIGDINEVETAQLSADNFDASVENKILANESTLMEMDEVITQIQQWRTALLHIPNEDNDDIIPSTSYHSEAYDKLFNSNKHADCPESSDNHEDNNTSIPYLADIDYIAKLQSLQSLIKERQSVTSITAHQQHMQEYQTLISLLHSKFGVDLNLLDKNHNDYNNSSSGSSSDCSDIDSDTEKTAYKTNINNNHSTIQHIPRNNNIEDSMEIKQKNHPITSTSSSRAKANHQANSLETEFQTINYEVKESVYSLCREKEDEVIQEGADLQQAVMSLEDSLRDFTGDLDRLLQG